MLVILRRGPSNTCQILRDAINAKNTAIAKATEEDQKCAGNVIKKILITT